MKIEELQANWEEFGRTDPLYAILTCEGKERHGWDTDEFFACGKSEIDALVSYIEHLGVSMARRKALDFGCGVGRLTQALGFYFDEVNGVDIASSMISLAQKYNQHGARCKYFVNDRCDLSLFSEDSFDLVYSNITLQHMPPRYSKNYIKELIRVSSPSGLLIFQLPGAAQTVSELEVTISKKIRIMIPGALLKVYHRVRYGGSKPVMQMYAVRETEVAALINRCGAELLDIVQEPMGEEGWMSLRYCVRKRGKVKKGYHRCTNTTSDEY